MNHLERKYFIPDYERAFSGRTETYTMSYYDHYWNQAAKKMC